MNNVARVLVCVLGLGVATCGGSDDGTKQLTSQDAFQELFFDLVLGFAEVFTELADTVGVANPASCPAGGSAGYDMGSGATTLTDCAAGGVTANGTARMSLQGGGEYSAMIFGGNLTITGDFEGTVRINSGTIQWAAPVADATTFWELKIDLDGEEVCIWSGADRGPCESSL